MNEIKHKDLIIAYANGAEIEVDFDNRNDWKSIDEYYGNGLRTFLSMEDDPVWQFRIKPPAPKPHKHAELIKAWADGAKIQFKGGNDEWFNCDKYAPEWQLDVEYRIAQDN